MCNIGAYMSMSVPAMGESYNDVYAFCAARQKVLSMDACLAMITMRMPAHVHTVASQFLIDSKFRSRCSHDQGVHTLPGCAEPNDFWARSYHDVTVWRDSEDSARSGSRAGGGAVGRRDHRF